LSTENEVGFGECPDDTDFKTELKKFQNFPGDLFALDKGKETGYF